LNNQFVSNNVSLHIIRQKKQLQNVNELLNVSVLPAIKPFSIRVPLTVPAAAYILVVNVPVEAVNDLLKDSVFPFILPFTIKLTYDSPSYVQFTIGGMDTGTSKVGCAAIANGKVLYQSEITLRQDVSSKMEQRAIYRRSRIGRKTRYRECRFDNRANSRREGRLAPSLKSKLESHLREKKFVESILPITKWKVELASFDIHKITNPYVHSF